MIYIIDAKIFLLGLLISLSISILFIFVISPFIKHVFICKKMFDELYKDIEPIISKIHIHEKEICKLKQKLKHIKDV